ncbi:hypothetical protein LCGC14_2703040 [marine sediment metagenome]|uniref:Antirestriction protein ArdA n=1 Tax=marine sediment metagenome TaxID=412755 RepID=A0A0F9C747_9ZZZZ
MAYITYYSLSDYNKGDLIPFTIDNVEDQTKDEHYDEIYENLERITEEKDDGETREEWIVADYEDIPKDLVGQWSIDDDYFEMTEAMRDSHLDEEVFLAGVHLDIPYDRIAEAYSGSAENDEEFAEEYAESTGMLYDVPDSLKRYFDYSAFARDLMMDFNEENGHYFSANW